MQKFFISMVYCMTIFSLQASQEQNDPWTKKILQIWAESGKEFYYQNLPMDIRRYKIYPFIKKENISYLSNLQIACNCKNFYKVIFLIQLGANPQIRLNTIMPNRYDDLNILKTQANIFAYLLKHGADINQLSENPINSEKENLLHYALDLNNVKFIPYLLKHKIDFNQKYYNETPLDRAIITANIHDYFFYKDYYKAAIYLKAAGAQSTIPLDPLPIIECDNCCQCNIS